MKALVQDRYGAPDEVLALGEVEKPVPADDAVLVRVEAASVNPVDWHMIRGDPYLARVSFGLRRPKDAVPGSDIAGRVEAVGSAVSGFTPGDEVVGSSFMRGNGAFAEYASVPADVLVPKPAGLTAGEAATLPMAGLTALQGLRDHASVEPGDAVLIIGASGGVGTFAVQIAKALDAEVTGASSAEKADLVRSLGADEVIDYRRESLLDGGRRYDVVFQLGGTASPSQCRRALTPKGTLLVSSGEPSGGLIGPLGRAAKAALLSPFVSQRLVSFTVKPNADGLRSLGELIEAGKVRPVIDREFPLDGALEAIRYLEDGHARGKVVVKP